MNELHMSTNMVLKNSKNDTILENGKNLIQNTNRKDKY